MNGKICGICQGSQSSGESDKEHENQNSEQHNLLKMGKIFFS